MGDYDNYEKLLEKQVKHVQLVAGDQYQSQENKSVNQMAFQAPVYTESFLTTQDRSQRNFYDEYKNNWKSDYAGEAIDSTVYFDPKEIQIQDDNFLFFQKKERKKITKDPVGMFALRMSELNEEDLGITVGETKAHTNELMCANIRLATIQREKDKIVDEALLKTKKEFLPLIGDYLPFIKALGPDLVAEYTNDVGDEVKITEASINEYKEYITRAFNDPVGTIKVSINDAIHSYGKISTKLLEKDSIAKRFEAAKQLRDRYKAVQDIMRSQNNNPAVADAIKDIKSNTLLKDNVAFATELYRRLDADLSYCMQQNNLSFTADRFLDRRDLDGGAYKTDGELTLRTILDQKKMKKDQEKEDSVDSYWREQITDRLLRLRLNKKEDKGENKEGEEKGKEKDKEKDKEKGKNKDKDKGKEREVNKAAEGISDGQDIIATADKISQDFDTTDDEKQLLFDELKTNVKAIASAITDINHELEIARHIRKNMQDGARVLRPELLKRIPWYVATRQQQLLNLMSRVAGYLNAMRYLTGKVRLDANGAQVIKSEQERIRKNSSKDEDTESENEFGFVNVDASAAYINSSGPGKDIVTLNKSPLTFEQFKKKVIKENYGSGDGYTQLVHLLDEKDASLQYDILVLEGKNLNTMKVREMVTAFENTKTSKERLDVLAEATKSYMDETDILYERLKHGGIFDLNDEERNDIVERATELKKKLYSINRVRNHKYGLGINNLTFGTLLISKLAADDKYSYKAEGLTKMKFKAIFDQLEQYRCQMIIDHLQTGAANDEMYTADEKKEIEARLKKNKVVDDKSKDGKTKDFIIMEYFAQKTMQAAELSIRHQDEMDDCLNGNKKLKTMEDKKKDLLNKAIELEKRQAKEKYEKKKADVKAEKERKKQEKERLEKERLEKEKLEKEKLEKERLEKERLEKEKLEKEKLEKEKLEKENKEENKEDTKEETKENKKEKETKETTDELFTKASKLKTKYTVKVSAEREKFPYSDKNENDPGTDSWAHAVASLINDYVGRFVVTGQMLLEDKDMKDKTVFGPKRNKTGDPKDYADLINKYCPNTAVAKATFDNYEFQEKGQFLSYIKNALISTMGPVILKRKDGFVTVYGIDKNNQLLCKRASTEDSSKLYTENPDVIFEDMDREGEVAMYYFALYGKNKEVVDLVESEQKVEYGIPKQVMGDKEASDHMQSLKEVEVISKEPASLEVKDKVVVKEKKNHPEYEYQGGTLYCWACAMNGLLNYHAKKKVSDLGTIKKYKMDIPKQEDTSIGDPLKYKAAVAEINEVKTGNKIGNPMIFGDYIFEKLPGTVIKSAQIPFVSDKQDLCKRRFKEELSQALEKGPVALLRNGHFVLVHELDGNTIKVKNSSNTDPDTVEEDHYTIDSLYSPEKNLTDIELVWLENIKGREKELSKEFGEITFDEKKKEFKKKGSKGGIERPSGVQTLLHKKGIEVSDMKEYDVVSKSAYIPIKM